MKFYVQNITTGEGKFIQSAAKTARGLLRRAYKALNGKDAWNSGRYYNGEYWYDLAARYIRIKPTKRIGNTTYADFGQVCLDFADNYWY